MAVYTVAQVTAHLRQKFESDPLLADLWVVGEASNLRVSSAGHSYFTLKDEQSVLRCVMFKGQPGSELLTEGTALSAHGHITFYERGGTTDFVVDLAMPEGLGELHLELERLRLRLGEEGLFEESRKRPLPKYPGVVGVVTSPAGAVFHDIQNVIQRRYPLVELLLSPTVVQGPNATEGVVAALDALNRDGRADVIIVARGGGSLEELWPFNEEAVARAVHASRIPVVSAIGHETDFTIIDQVADVRAPTPSAAAELVVPDGWALRRELDDFVDRSGMAMIYMFQSNRSEVAGMVRKLESGLPDGETWRRRVDDLARIAGTAMSSRLALAKNQVESIGLQLGALDPAATLSRGFSVVQKAGSDQVVTTTGQVAPGDALTITVTDGVVPATAGAEKAAKDQPKGTSKKRRTVPQGAGMKRLL
ncbi:MAG: exodeoxyribonuclease VII large subunit [SAR202 cluster bacterium Io17-Chloro-G9]|nr:MAG: exodeoxyribonuclease VII large subunit [SAR202 cluster bacterium Io17-Chloro-G9]